MKPSKKEYQELKDFKLRVGIEMINAWNLFLNANVEIKKNSPYSPYMALKEKRVYPTHTCKIGNTSFTFKPDETWHPEGIEKQLRKFKTTRW